MIQICLHNVHFHAFHGVLPQERAVGNDYTIDLVLDAKVFASTESDKLEDTISYAEIYTLLAEEMSTPSQLLEHVVGRMARRILSSFASIERVYIKLHKHRPPIAGEIGSAAVALTLDRSELSQP